MLPGMLGRSEIDDYGTDDYQYSEPPVWEVLLAIPIVFIIVAIAELLIIAGLWVAASYHVFIGLKNRFGVEIASGLFIAGIGLCMIFVFKPRLQWPSTVSPVVVTPTTVALITRTATATAVPSPVVVAPTLTPPVSPPVINRAPTPSPTPATPTSVPTVVRTVKSVFELLVDDFSPQPEQGQRVYFFNRLDGDRGVLVDTPVVWGNGVVTTGVSSGLSWGGLWMSLNHPIREALPINFSAILPSQIVPAYQSHIIGLNVLIADATPKRIFRLELKSGDQLKWSGETVLTGGRQLVTFSLPALGDINHLVWVLDKAAANDYVVLDNISFSATTEIRDAATAGFVWSYAMLLNNWNPQTGLARDKSKDASREFDAIQSTGSLAAATSIAAQLGVITRSDATSIVNKIGRTLVKDTPRLHGLWPHWVKVSSTGVITIVQGTEWSSVDTVIAALGLIDAQYGLGIDSTATEDVLKSIDWAALLLPTGISHGFTYERLPIPYAWDVFGGETWLVELAYAGATHKVAPIQHATPPTANGSGFIDELAWLFVAPPAQGDYWGTDWKVYRSMGADKQLSYYALDGSSTCLKSAGLFGLSASEVPLPGKVPPPSVYQAFGLGGRFAQSNDGREQMGGPVAVPHYSAMIASLRPGESIRMWEWLINSGYFSPLTNIESLTMPAGSNPLCSVVGWNDLKGSWNLALQALGWGRYLDERSGHVPILWQAAISSEFLRDGYRILVPVPQPANLVPTALPVGVAPTARPTYVNPTPYGNPVNWHLTNR